jgi:hypothetical protein
MLRAVLLLAASAVCNAFVLTPGSSSALRCGRLGAAGDWARPSATPAGRPLDRCRTSRLQARRGAAALKAAFPGYESMLTLDTPAAWAAFLLWSVPLPATIGVPRT